MRLTDESAGDSLPAEAARNLRCPRELHTLVSGSAGGQSHLSEIGQTRRKRPEMQANRAGDSGRSARGASDLCRQSSWEPAVNRPAATRCLPWKRRLFLGRALLAGELRGDFLLGRLLGGRCSIGGRLEAVFFLPPKMLSQLSANCLVVPTRTTLMVVLRALSCGSTVCVKRLNSHGD